MADGLDASVADAVEISCPHCRTKSPFNLPSDGRHELTCPKCEKTFTALLAIVRAKRSRGDKRLGTRDYALRIKHGSKEELIQFHQSFAHGADIELRQGDTVAITLYKGTVIAVHNLTIDDVNVVGFIKKPVPGIVVFFVLSVFKCFGTNAALVDRRLWLVLVEVMRLSFGAASVVFGWLNV